MRNRRRLICLTAKNVVRAELHGPAVRLEDFEDLNRLKARARAILWLEFRAPVPLFVFDGAAIAAVIPTGNGSCVKIPFRAVQINRWNRDKRSAELVLAPADWSDFAFVTALAQAAAVGQCFADQVTDLELYPEDDPASRVWQPCLRPDAPAFGAASAAEDPPVVQTAAA